VEVTIANLRLVVRLKNKFTKFTRNQIFHCSPLRITKCYKSLKYVQIIINFEENLHQAHIEDSFKKNYDQKRL
jgi:hypothetical protein